MDWLSRIKGIFQGKKEDGLPAMADQPTNGVPVNIFPKGIRFGRYSDNNKSKAKTRAWYVAEDRFKEKNYPETFKAFFDYLSDDEERNVEFKQEGNKFTLQRFHDEMLRHGAPPVRLLRELMLKDRSKWNELF